jgi:ribulose-bisphosphate carboxylase large chain
MPGVMPVALAASAGQMHQLPHYLGEDVIPVRRRHHRPSDGIRPARRRTGSRSSTIQARNEGRDYYQEGPTLERAAKGAPS